VSSVITMTKITTRKIIVGLDIDLVFVSKTHMLK
jgi:hypothetical protein